MFRLPIVLALVCRAFLIFPQEAESLVKKELETMLGDSHWRGKLAKKFHDPKGYLLIDLRLDARGKAISLFVVETDLQNVALIEYLSDEVLKHRFHLPAAQNQKLITRQKLSIN